MCACVTVFVNEQNCPKSSTQIHVSFGDDCRAHDTTYTARTHGKHGTGRGVYRFPKTQHATVSHRGAPPPLRSLDVYWTRRVPAVYSFSL